MDYRTFAHTLTLTSLSMLNSCVRASKVFTFRFINIFAAVRLSIFSFIVNCGVNVNQNSLPFTAKTKQTAGCQVDRGGKKIDGDDVLGYRCVVAFANRIALIRLCSRSLSLSLSHEVFYNPVSLNFFTFRSLSACHGLCQIVKYDLVASTLIANNC